MVPERDLRPTFERESGRYEDWYRTRRGRRASRAEQGLLAELVALFPTARSVLEVGCGTGHFTRWLAERGLEVIALDRSPAMLREFQRHGPHAHALRADAQALPLRAAAVDLALFVTVLEFVESPARALAEAVRVSREGLIVIALNRWSLGAISRRCGPGLRRPLLGRARDASQRELCRWLEAAGGERFEALHWSSALFPGPLPLGPARLPLGDVLGAALVLRR